jgi:hypothetical protein
MEFLPSAATCQMMNSFGLCQRLVGGGFELYGKSGVSLDYISRVSGINCFEFEIRNTDPDFYVFTDLPVDQLGQLLYSSGSAVSADNGSATLIPVFVPHQAVPVFGRLQIFFDILGGADSIQFKINYQARATEWQYYIINSSQMALESLAISGSDGISFNGPQQAVLPNGQQALLFSSGNFMLSMSEKPKYKFNLMNKSGDSEGSTALSAAAIYMGLPGADRSRITVSKNNHVSSPIYVYI